MTLKDRYDKMKALLEDIERLPGHCACQERIRWEATQLLKDIRSDDETLVLIRSTEGIETIADLQAEAMQWPAEWPVVVCCPWEDATPNGSRFRLTRSVDDNHHTGGSPFLALNCNQERTHR